MKRDLLYVIVFIASICLISACSGGTTKNAPENESAHKLMSEKELSQMTEEINNLFNAPESYNEGVKSYQEAGAYGFVNENGDVVIPAKYESVGCFNEGLASVTLNGKMGYINHSGELVIPAIYDFTNFFSQGVAYACKDGKFGYINKKGETVIDFIYDNATDFWEVDGFAAVKLNGKEGLIDIRGNIVMPISFEHASSTMDGVATIFDGNKEISVYNDKSYKITTY